MTADNAHNAHNADPAPAARSAPGTGFPVSLEFFPPKTAEGVGKLRATRQQLYPLQPDFCSVTYGAGGSTQEGTFGTVRDILAEGVSAASHFSCIGATRATVRQELALLREMGVKRLVALRVLRAVFTGCTGSSHAALLAYTKNSRLPSPP